MRTYKTWEVIKMIDEDNSLEFKRVDKDTKLWADDRYLAGSFKDKLGINGNVNLDGEWKLIQKPVDFITAINSGKKIKSEHMTGCDNVEDLMDTLSAFSESFVLKVINGKWFIMEGE